MRKPIQKIVALCCVGAMALCFASCKPDDTNTESTTDPVTVESTEEPSSEESTAPVDNGGEDTSAPQNTNTGIAKPGSPAEAVKLYNDAIAKKGAVTATITRSLSEVKAAGIDVLKMVPQVPEKFDLNDAPLEGADLVALDAGSVAGMKCTESGDNYVIEFTLNALETGKEVKVGDGGYMYLLDYATIEKTVLDVGHGIDPNFTLEIKNLKSLTIDGGKLSVTINKTTGNISAASITFNEKISATVVTSATGSFPVPANIVGGGTVKYTVA